MNINVQEKQESYYNMVSPKGIVLFSLHVYSPDEPGDDSSGVYIREEVGLTAILPKDFSTQKFLKPQAAVQYCYFHLENFINSLSK